MSGRNVIIVKHKEVRLILISGLKEYKYNEHIRVFTTAPLVQLEEPTWVNTKHPWLSGFKASCLSMY